MSRLMKGATYTFGIALVTVIGSLLMGLALGAMAGMSKGVKSSIFNHVLDLALTIPSLLLAIIIVAVLGPGLWNTTWAIMLALLPQFVHGIRNAIQDTLKQDYVAAYRLDGASNWQVLRYAVSAKYLGAFNSHGDHGAFNRYSGYSGLRLFRFRCSGADLRMGRDDS